MKVVRSTKLFRQVSVVLSLIMAAISICVLVIPQEQCEDGTNIKAALGLVFSMWTIVFVLLLLQVIGMTKCLK